MIAVFHTKRGAGVLESGEDADTMIGRIMKNYRQRIKTEVWDSQERTFCLGGVYPPLSKGEFWGWWYDEESMRQGAGA